jgi:hypothetical protein
MDRDMVDVIITVCEFMGPAAASAIAITLLLIALEKVRV